MNVPPSVLTRKMFDAALNGTSNRYSVPEPVGSVAAPMSFFTFGGSKQSFFGDLKAHGRESVLFYTQNKTSIQRWW